ncbi:hypothetical protein Hdeb2414_s0007g00226801 [Helianthus debilis subsp. tardiflorus]
MSSTTTTDDYSPAETLITFNNPIPLLRHPTPSTTDDSLILCFPNPKSFATAYNQCESNIINQCTSGARIGCSVSASKKCAPPWWKTLAGGGVSKQALEEREKCEEREMAECLEGSRVRCVKFAEDKCWPAFRDARVVVAGGGGGGEGKKCVVELVSRVWFGGRRIGGVEVGGLDGSWSRIRSRIGFRIVRGSDLLEKEV